MTDNKWGGVRPGAGRPKKENPKKMYSFRLSDDELKAIKEVLSKMRNKIIILFCLFMLNLPALAQPLKATISYSEEDARIEAFEGVSKYCPFKGETSFQRSLFVTSINNDDVLEIQEFNMKLFKTIPYRIIAVIYKDAPNFIYYYEKTKNGYIGMVIDVIYKSDYSVKTVKYNSTTGKLMSVGLAISEDEDFIFDENKKTIGHWVGNKEYINKSSTRKIIYSAQ